jgi:hypothetical protein
LERWRRQAREEGPRASFPAAAFDPDSLFIIADFLLGSHYFAVHLTPSPAEISPVLRIFENECEPRAPSFTDFITTYLDDPDTVY